MQFFNNKNHFSGTFFFLCLGPRSNDMSQPIYVGFEQDVFKTVADYFLSLPEPLLTFEYYELFVNILGMYLSVALKTYM